MIEDSACVVPYVQLVPGRGHLPVCAPRSIEEVWFIDNPVGLENAAISLFGQLRMCVAEAFDSESESVPAVFHFVIDFALKIRMRLMEILDVLNILMASPAWAESFMVSLVPARVCRASSQTACKPSSDEQLIEAVSDTARL